MQDRLQDEQDKHHSIKWHHTSDRASKRNRAQKRHQGMPELTKACQSAPVDASAHL